MSEPIALSALVSTTPSLLAYSIPLLIVSVPLTFAGTFLTFDRSRSFPSSYAPVVLPTFDKPRKFPKLRFSLEGGIGGLASGYVFGVHLSTFLSLLIPAASSSANLSSSSFLAVWILSCILTTILGGRYRYCARIFAALSGGSLLALAICVVIHPPLLPRQILPGLFAGLSLLLSLTFSLPNLFYLLRPAMRVFIASGGAFSMVLSIALLAHIPAWANVWERLWVASDITWGTSKEQGLSATYFILFSLGIASDYGLHTWLGECPDEKWDKYLANYSAHLPNEPDRAGSFRPLPNNSLWGRLFGFSRGVEKDTIFPIYPPSQTRNSAAEDPLSDDEGPMHMKLHSTALNLSYENLPSSPTFLKKTHSQNVKFKRKKGRGFSQIGTRGRKEHIKFGQDFSSDSSDNDSDGPQIQRLRPWLKGKASTGSSSSPTLVDQPLLKDVIDPEYEKLRKARATAGSGPGTPIYSDYEEDIGIPPVKRATLEGDTGWRPEFLERYTSSAGVNTSVSGAVTSSTSSHSSAPIGAVPATPSLIRALDRIFIAQRDAFGPPGSPPALIPTQLRNLQTKEDATKMDGLPNVREVEDDDSDIEADGNVQRIPRWEEFWREVKHKAMT